MNSSNSLCKNKVANQAELFDIIKYYYGEYSDSNKRNGRDSVQSIKLLNELFIFLIFNLNVLTNNDIKEALKKQLEHVSFEFLSSKTTDIKIKGDFNATIIELLEKLK